MTHTFHTIDEALSDLRAGKMIIVVDDEQRENEGDLVLPAQFCTPEKMAFIIRYTGGVVCLALKPEIVDRLELFPMVKNNTAQRGTAYTVSIDAATGVSTGISAEDRTRTILATIAPDARPDDLVRPGHVFPLRAQEGGVLHRAGHTEASVDLCRLSGLSEGALVSELMHDDGTMMRLPALFQFAKDHHLKIISIADLIAYRSKNECLIRLDAETDLMTETGLWHIKIYRDLLHETDHVALTKGSFTHEDPVLVRVHSECMTGDIFGSQQCDCGSQLHQAMKDIDAAQKGVVLYMTGHEGRGIGLVNKIRAYELQMKEKMDTIEANKALGFPEDLRDYGIGSQILVHLGVRKIRLMTNNPKKMGGITGYGLDIVEQVPIEIAANHSNYQYLKTKKEKMGHLFKNL
jgi:3,4-dihydroxy 2-butanone 4-phosphate synthase/GTP cyclohydrolase II